MPKNDSQKKSVGAPTSKRPAPHKNFASSSTGSTSKPDVENASRKRRKLDVASSNTVTNELVDFPRGTSIYRVRHDRNDHSNHNRNLDQQNQPHTVNDGIDLETSEMKNGESIAKLRKMVLGQVEYSDAQQAPGKYLSLDCEMVGVGPGGDESSLARVSLVNYHGAVQLDEFVKQREHVVDYRTQWSGIRAKDLINARPFQDVQKKVAEILNDRILVGHAVHNDLKVLLLSHPRHLTRDTQTYASKFEVVNTKRVALRNLVKQELDVTIQGGEHSSVTDARATMAVFRIHRKEWEKGSRPITATGKSNATKKRKRSEEVEASELPWDMRNESKKYPGGGRKGVSSGLSLVVKQKKTGVSSGEKPKWWKSLDRVGKS